MDITKLTLKEILQMMKEDIYSIMREMHEFHDKNRDFWIYFPCKQMMYVNMLDAITFNRAKYDVKLCITQFHHTDKVFGLWLINAKGDIDDEFTRIINELCPLYNDITFGETIQRLRNLPKMFDKWRDSPLRKIRHTHCFFDAIMVAKQCEFSMYSPEAECFLKKNYNIKQMFESDNRKFCNIKYVISQTQKHLRDLGWVEIADTEQIINIYRNNLKWFQNNPNNYIILTNGAFGKYTHFATNSKYTRSIGRASELLKWLAGSGSQWQTENILYMKADFIIKSLGENDNV